MGGVCGVYSLNGPVIFNLLNATQRLQHLGQGWTGFALTDNRLNSDPINYIVKPGTVRNEFPLDYIADEKDETYIPKEKFSGHVGIGVTNPAEKQPMCLTSKIGQFALAFDGRILNADKLKQEFFDRGQALYRGSEVEILMKLVTKGSAETGNIIEGIKYMNNKIVGSNSTVVLHKNNIYACRDGYAVNPLQMGESENLLIVSSETDSIRRTGAKFVRDVAPGEIIRLSENGIESIFNMPSKKLAHCAFRPIYTSRADAVLDGINSDLVRKKIGAWHMEQDLKEGLRLDFTAGMPMSGTSYGLGAAIASMKLFPIYGHFVPHNEAFLYDRYSGRSYILDTQFMRDMMAGEKVSVMEHNVEGKSFSLYDDSIVRLTVLVNTVEALFDAGAKKVHVRAGFPPLIDKCLLNVSTKKKEELAIYKYKDVEGICEKLGATSLRYTPRNVLMDILTEGTNLTKNNFCTYCITSENPLLAEA
jgi:amidophosphoribosyltransferase